ncbi:unnamed protein product [Fraxinus pennsylvanica]|uniref:Disease resistance N-terminal domain-containing protein n=1 Tax=Fraxinus pennsylvanica TaxID=56036 RepID=A0AAD2DPA3_9LAMI|nr:unnamed protein product [Fraxinus pennsylvanica]
MTDATVAFVLENLKELIDSTSKQISEVNNKVRSLIRDLDFFKGFLQDATKKPIEDAAMKALVKQIRIAVYEAEDIVDEYVIEAAQHKSSSMFKKIKHPLEHPTKLLNLAQKIEPMKEMVNEIYKKKEFGDVGRLDREGSSTSKIAKAPIVEEDHVARDLSFPFILLITINDDLHLFNLRIATFSDNSSYNNAKDDEDRCME